MAEQTLREENETDILNETEGFDSPNNNAGNTPQPTRSLYALTRKEITRGIANRFVHSRTYIILYLTMAALSITTVVLSLGSGCPPTAFYVLEFIINSAMILEVSIRLIAFGKQFWKSPFNIIDLVLTVFCAITILAVTLVGCGGTGSKAEELFDTLLLVARNLLQFVRLAAVTRQSGRSLFSRPRPIDLSAAGSRRLDIDIEDDDEWAGNAGYRRLPNGVGLDEEAGPGAVVFDADLHRPNPWAATRTNNNEDDEDAWAQLG